MLTCKQELRKTYSRVSRVYLLMVKEPKHLISPTSTNDEAPLSRESMLSLLARKHIYDTYLLVTHTIPHSAKDNQRQVKDMRTF